MAKYNIVELEIQNQRDKKGTLPDLKRKRDAEQKALEGQNAIYIYRGAKSRKIYIGQTKHFLERHKEHYSGTEEKFDTADFDRVMVVFSVYFNRSALDDVEGQLITYFLADNSSSGRNSVEFDHDEVINRTGGNSVNEYVDREKVASEVILPLWQRELYPRRWVATATLDELRTRELVKYSPIKSLTPQQGDLIREIVGDSSKNYVINGDAGTGKTVLLTHLAAQLLKARSGERIAVVVQPNWEKTAADIFRVYGVGGMRLSVLTSTKLITARQRYDVIIVDESHKLSRRYGKQHPSFHAVYDLDGFGSCDSRLEILQRLGGQIILMYDVLQAIRPANITRDMFMKLTGGYERRFLKTQFRIQTSKEKPYTSDDYINGIKYLLYKDTGLLETGLTGFDPEFDREAFRDRDPDAYFGYFTERPLHSLKEWLEEDRNFNPEHINRILAGLVEDWAQKEGKDPAIRHWHEEDLHLRWNSSQENWIRSKDPDAEDQVGSVFAVQGIDLNKVGVLIGSDLRVDGEGKLTADPESFYNTNGTFTRKEMELPENQYEFTIFVLNIYYVLLTRGIDGIRVGFWKNDAFREYMERVLEIG